MFIEELDQRQPEFMAYILDEIDMLSLEACNPGHLTFLSPILAINFGKEHAPVLRELADQLEADQA